MCWVKKDMQRAIKFRLVTKIWKRTDFSERQTYTTSAAVKSQVNEKLTSSQSQF